MKNQITSETKFMPDYRNRTSFTGGNWVLAPYDLMAQGGGQSGSTNLVTEVWVNTIASDSGARLIQYRYGYACVLQFVVPKNWYFKIQANNYRDCFYYPLVNTSN